MSVEDLASKPLPPPCVVDWNYAVPRMICVCVAVVAFYYVAWFLWRWYYRDKQCRHCGRAFVDLSAVVERADLLMVPHLSDALGTVARATVNAFIEQLAKRKLLVETAMTEEAHTELMAHLTTVIVAGVQAND